MLYFKYKQDLFFLLRSNYSGEESLSTLWISTVGKLRKTRSGLESKTKEMKTEEMAGWGRLLSYL